MKSLIAGARVVYSGGVVGSRTPATCWPSVRRGDGEERVSSRATLLAGAVVYGLLVFLGTAGLGFVVLPSVGYHTGLFSIETEAEAAFSLVTLKAVPFLVGLSAGAAFSYRWLMRLSMGRRFAVYAATTVLAWVAGAAVAAFLQG
jgi:hypothetical protein